MENRIQESRTNYSRLPPANSEVTDVQNSSRSSSAASSSSSGPARSKSTNPFIVKYFKESFSDDGSLIHTCRWENRTKVFKGSTSITNKRKHVNTHTLGNTKWEKLSIVEREKTLVKFITTTASPYSLIENTWFRIMTGLKISSKKLSKLILACFKDEQQKLSQRFSNISEISITTDIWSASTKKSFATYTGHFFNNGSVESTVIHFTRIKHPHNAANLQLELEKVIWTFGLQSKIFSITSDDASNNRASINLFNSVRSFQNLQPIKRVSCFCHMIHNVVIYVIDENAFDSMILKVRKLANTVHMSGRLREELSQRCANHASIRNLTVITDCKTRWNSTYLMLQRLIELREPMDELCVMEPLLIDHQLGQDHWQQAVNLVKFLEPFYNATVELSKRDTFNYSLVYPQFKALVRHCKETIAESANQHHTFASPALFKLKTYKSKVINDDSLMATFLDPYLKCNLKQSHKERLLINLKKELEKTQPMDPSSSEPSSSPASSTRASLRASLRMSPQPINEVDSYLAEDVSFDGDDIAVWWFNKRFLYPNIFQIAKRYIVTRPSSVASESCFSIASWLTPPKRNRLCDESIQSNIFLHSVYSNDDAKSV